MKTIQIKLPNINNMKTIQIKLPNISDISWVVTCEYEHTHPRGYFASDDNEFDEQIVQSILKNSEWNEWAWCMVKVEGIYKGLSAYNYIGCCSNESREDFIENSGSFVDMQEEVYGQIIKQLEDLK